jgi:hypothetical protein
MCQNLYLLAGYLLLLFVHRKLRMEMVNLNLHFILLTALSLSFIHVAAITCHHLTATATIAIAKIPAAAPPFPRHRLFFHIYLVDFRHRCFSF